MERETGMVKGLMQKFLGIDDLKKDMEKKERNTKRQIGKMKGEVNSLGSQFVDRGEDIHQAKRQIDRVERKANNLDQTVNTDVKGAVSSILQSMKSQKGTKEAEGLKKKAKAKKDRTVKEQKTQGG